MIYLCCLRFLRDLEKWSWILNLRKNEGKMGKNGVKWLSENPRLYTTYRSLIFHFRYILKCRLQFVSIWNGLKFCRLVMAKLQVKKGTRHCEEKN